MRYFRQVWSDFQKLLEFLVCPWYDLFQFIEEWETMRNEKAANEIIWQTATQKAMEKAKIEKVFAAPLPRMRPVKRQPWWKFWA